MARLAIKKEQLYTCYDKIGICTIIMHIILGLETDTVCKAYATIQKEEESSH